MLKKGTTVYLSEFGCKDFIYPNIAKMLTLQEDAKILEKNFFWQHDPSYKPYLILYKNKKLLVWTENNNANRNIS